MSSRYSGAVGLAVLFLVSSLSRADEPAPDKTSTDFKVLKPVEMSARIDELIAARWKLKGATPAPLADDAEYFRRLCLDLNGRIPSIVDLTNFLDDPDPAKRRTYVDKLFTYADASSSASEAYYVTHFTTFWRQLLFSQTTNQQAQFIGIQAEPWLRGHVKNNTPYNKMVHELLTRQQGGSFYQANENKPENIAASTARLFLGVKLECAQCHDDRSGGSWTRAQFWEYAAFFSQATVFRGRQAIPANPGQPPKIKIPDKDQMVQARFLDGKDPVWQQGKSAQAVLADWMTAPDNPYFARAAVNRMWFYFLGTGLIDPVDAWNADNPASHPELLDELTRQFTAHDFDIKYLIRAITSSKAYQLTSVQSHDSQKDPRLFARMPVRGLTPEQLYDSLQVATGFVDNSQVNPYQGFGANTPRGEFLAKFANSVNKSVDAETSILQALFLMNGKVMGEMTTWSQVGQEKMRTLEAVVEDTRHPLSRNIDGLYLAALSRRPRPAEMERLLKFAQGKDRAQVLSDIFWVLLNSGEFNSNH